jgi:serine protease Do
MDDKDKEKKHEDDITKENHEVNVNHSDDSEGDVKRETDKNVLFENMLHNDKFNDVTKVSNKRNRKNFFGIACLVCVAAAICGISIGFGFGLVNNFVDGILGKKSNKFFSFGSNTNPSVDVISTPSSGMSSNNYSNSDYLSMIDRVSKSVVAISTSVDTVDHFFGFPIRQSGSGSGVIFHDDGDKVYIVTNCHVINTANNVNVSIEGSDAVSAHLIGKNVEADLAVIYINRADLNNLGIADVKVAEFGDSSSIRLGESISAIGNALGEGNTVTSGIISAKDKKINIDGRELSVIQINASINPGNSGGALINSNGEIIGITTAKYAQLAVEGIGYCISSNDVKPVIEDLMNRPDQPYLGIYAKTLTQDIAHHYGLPAMGVYVDAVYENSPCKKAGVLAGDIITMINDHTIYEMKDIVNLLKEYKIGDTVKLHILRQSQVLELNVKLEQNKDNGF